MSEQCETCKSEIDGLTKILMHHRKAIKKGYAECPKCGCTYCENCGKVVWNPKKGEKQ